MRNERNLLRKYEGNPILRPLTGSYWESEQCRNPAAIYHDGEFHLIYTASGDIVRDHLIYLGHAVSDDGYHFRRVGVEPMVAPSMDEFGGFDAGGVEDPRIVKIEDTFYITYMARAVGFHAYRRGVRRRDIPRDAGPTWTLNYRRGGLLRSKDLKTFERMGPITSEHVFDANVILFPEKINGRFAMLHRPSDDLPESAEVEAGISICFSDDLIHWDDDKPLIAPIGGWQEKIGGSAPPVKTERGWLTLYHGVEFADGKEDWSNPAFPFAYRTGLMLLDLDDPSKVIAKSTKFIMEPTESYEKWGTVNNVVFPTGTVLRGDDLFIYYGGADTVSCVANASVKKLLEYLQEFPVD